ncbi:hypothetical protein [Sphingosinithalassobacter sp. CS137]|uniref:hypothetical protein n=1 Tax=Sphingosinithalassobacter sp. CS137 TaxID=2762748 RepID=UPI00165D6C61|nr:hypothetical protein [Sphingosinithalassobacter sp. CS137]
MRKLIIPVLLALPLASGGCVAKAAWDVATLPVRAGSQVVDWTTTSQEESDRNYGRRVREQEAREGREHRAQEREERERCERERRRDCD